MNTPAKDLYGSCIVVDATAPITPYAAIDINVGPEERVLPYREAGVTLAVFTVVDDYPNSIEQTVKLLGANRQFFLQRSDRYVLADNAADVRRAREEGKLAISFAFQGTNALLGELSLVEVYRRLGVTQMLLAYNAGNLVADGCHEPRNAGLSRFGRSLIAEMNRVGVIVDVSHTGLRSSLEAMEISSKPPIFSHSTPKKFAPHDRNITDEQIRACAAKDGIVGLTGLGIFMDGATRRASVTRLADTVEYVIQLVGARHAAFGLDYIVDTQTMARYLRGNAGIYGGGGQYPADGVIDSAAPSILPEVTEQLLRRRYSDDDVRGVLGENYLRVLEAQANA
jgi:membrane dipeptidase